MGRWKDKIKRDLREIGQGAWRGLMWFRMDKLRDNTNMIMNHRVRYNAGNWLTVEPSDSKGLPSLCCMGLVSSLTDQQRYTLRRGNLRITAATRHGISLRYPLRPGVEQYNGPAVSVNSICKRIPDTSPATSTRLHLKQLVIPAVTNTLCFKQNEVGKVVTVTEPPYG
jgi:hypothetical protein